MNASLQPPRIFKVADLNKITAYLLNVNHPDPNTRAKAAFFKSKGFDAANPQVFVIALEQHPSTSQLNKVINNGYVDKFIYEGDLIGPNGRITRIRSIWKIDSQPGVGELISAYRY